MQQHHPIIASWAAWLQKTIQPGYNLDECDHLDLHPKTWTGTKELQTKSINKEEWLNVVLLNLKELETGVNTTEQ